MMRGDDVEQVQTFLNQQGYDVTVDGILGPETAGAVRDYQEDKGLSVDGVVGPNTREEIKKDLGIEDVRHEIYFSHDTDKVYWTDNTGKIIKSWQASDDIIGWKNREGETRESLPAGEYIATAYTPGINYGRAYGTGYIDTGDSRGRDIHGGGSRLTSKDEVAQDFVNKEGAYAPRQELLPTYGCIRMHNEDVEELCNLIIDEGNNIPLHVSETIEINDDKIINYTQ